MKQLYFIQYEVKPTSEHTEHGSIEGAYANCWIMADSAAQAEHIALDDLTADAWSQVSREDGPVVVCRQDYADDPDVLFYMDAAQHDGACYLLHQWDRTGIEEHDDAQRHAAWLLDSAERPERVC
jgi:hypothetical protein